jgi:S-adenosyl methyltransferase
MIHTGDRRARTLAGVDRPHWASEDVDMDRPSPARMYDALLGGSHNFAVDRAAAARAVAAVPDLPDVAMSNRAFLRRAVRHLCEVGIRQFLDLGAGIPTVGNTHEIAQAAAPGCRVCYVDIDPVAVTHAGTLLADNPAAIAVQGDLRTPEDVLGDPQVAKFLDLDEPVGVLLVAVLHLITDDERPGELVAALRRAVQPGSYFAISHLSSAQRPEDAAKLADQAANRSGVPIIFRTGEEITALFDGLAVVDPGVVPLPAWRPESPEDIGEDPDRSLGLAGVGRKD